MFRESRGKRVMVQLKRLKTNNKKILKNVVSTCSCNHFNGKYFLKGFLTSLHYQHRIIKMRRVRASNGAEHSKKDLYSDETSHASIY